MAKVVRVRREVAAERSTDDPIVCKICLACYDEGPRQPLVLQCRHTFCALCIADSLMTPDDRSKVICPLCKSRTVLGRRGITELPVNETSLETIRSLERRKQLELAERERAMRAGLEGIRPQYVNGTPKQVEYPLGSAKPVAQPGLPKKGILKVKPKQELRPKQDLQVDLHRNSSKPPGENSGGKISADHTVIVKSMDRLHPPPHRTNFENSPDVTTTEPSEADATDTVGGNTGGTDGLDTSELDVRFSDDGFVPTIQNSYPDLLTCLAPEERPFFPRPSTQSADPNFVIPNTTPDPFRLDTITTTTTTTDPNARIYPVNALMYMATAEGVPLDQLASADPTTTTTSDLTLTDSQRRLPGNAKYVGRFGNYSEKRQPGSLQGPKRISCSMDGFRLAISDHQSQGVHLFSSKGEFIGFFEVPNASGAVCFLADDQHLAVSTTSGVQIHLKNGQHRKTIPIVGVLGLAALREGFVAAARYRISVCKSVVGSVIHSINGKRDAQLNRKLIPFDEIVDVAVSSKAQLCILEARVILVTDEEGVVLTLIRPDQDSPCGPIGRGVAIASCPDSQGIVVVDEGFGRVLLFGGDGEFDRNLVTLDRGPGGAGGSVRGVAVTKSGRMLVVSEGEKMAEVRAYTF